MLDETYRKAGKMDVSRFAARLDVGACGILDAITPYLLEGREDVEDNELRDRESRPFIGERGRRRVVEEPNASHYMRGSP